MYCPACGKALLTGARYCPHCGQPSASDSVTSSTAGELEPASAQVAQSVSGDSAPVPALPSASKSALRFSVEAVVLSVLAVTCILLGALQGFIPIFLIEGLALGGLAWLCFFRRTMLSGLRSAVFIASLLLAGLVGVTLDEDMFGPHYRYLSQGSAQYRVDERAGRTDRLGTGGWTPVAYDRDAQQIPLSLTDGNNPFSKYVFDPAGTISLSEGSWTSAFGSGGKICFIAANSSNYVVDRILIDVALKGKSDAAQTVTLKNEVGGLIGAGTTGLVCGSPPQGMSASDGWTYSSEHAYGWKR